jgi:hypothetical protein
MNFLTGKFWAIIFKILKYTCWFILTFAKQNLNIEKITIIIIVHLILEKANILGSFRTEKQIHRFYIFLISLLINLFAYCPVQHDFTVYTVYCSYFNQKGNYFT